MGTRLPRPLSVPEPATEASNSYLDDALAAFRAGNYSDAMRNAGHTLVDSPQDQTAHQIMELSLLATDDYRGAAMEAHAVVQFGGVPTWSDVYGLYGNADTYTDQLRGLEKFVRDNPQAPRGTVPAGLSVFDLGLLRLRPKITWPWLLRRCPATRSPNNC